MFALLVESRGYGLGVWVDLCDSAEKWIGLLTKLGVIIRVRVEWCPGIMVQCSK
jgi:hypothetical protein